MLVVELDVRTVENHRIFSFRHFNRVRIVLVCQFDLMCEIT